MITPFLAFLILGVVFGLFYSIFGDDIFEWNADPDTNPDGKEGKNRKHIKDKFELIRKEAPTAWLVERCWHRFIGVFIGWMILWYLLDIRLGLFSSLQKTPLSLIDLALFVLAWVGINGRLSTIAHAIQSWFTPPWK